MSKDYEKYHGLVIRTLVASIPSGVHVQPKDAHGITNCFQINHSIGLLIKHSSKRMSPWVFSFTSDNLLELQLLIDVSQQTFIAFVCGWDGFLILNEAELEKLADKKNTENSLSIHVERRKRHMYAVGGRRKLERSKPRGFSQEMLQLLTK